MASSSGRYFGKGTPMIAMGHQSEDGGSFVISDTGTDEADHEIRRILLGNIDAVIPASGEVRRSNQDDEVEEHRPQCAPSPTSRFARFSEPWNHWADLPTRRKKAAILKYFSMARSFRILTESGERVRSKCCFSLKDDRITEMQITDCDGCPLFDAWLQRSAWSHSTNRWIIESCGNLILTIHQCESVVTTERTASSQPSVSSKSLFPQEPNKTTCRRWLINDWNGERFGYLVASGGGEAVFIEYADKETVGKFLRQCTLSRTLRTDSSELTENFSTIHTPVIGKYSRRIRRCVPLVQNVTWTCVHHESEQRLARLENDQLGYSDVRINLATKLLILAAIVKIVGDLQRALNDYSCVLYSDGRG